MVGYWVNIRQSLISKTKQAYGGRIKDTDKVKSSQFLVEGEVMCDYSFYTIFEDIRLMFTLGMCFFQAKMDPI